MGVLRSFREHPASVGESYGVHLAAAGGFGVRLFAAALACWVHALVPSLFPDAASGAVRQLHGELDARRQLRRAPSDA